MANIRVNLLKKSRVLTEKQYQFERKVLVWSVFGFVVALAVTMAMFAWQVFLSIQLSAVEKKTAEINMQLSGLKAASAQQLYIKARLQMITNFLKGRAEMREALQRVFSIPVAGVTVSAVSFDEQDVLRMQVMADSAKSFDAVYKYFEENKDFFTQVVNKGVSRSQDGAYAMSMLLSLPKANKVK